MQDIKYVNHLGEEVSLGRGTYKMLKDTSGITDAMLKVQERYIK